MKYGRALIVFFVLLAILFEEMVALVPSNNVVGCCCLFWLSEDWQLTATTFHFWAAKSPESPDLDI